MTGMSGEFRLGPQSGELRLETRREGFAARVGHDLTIVVARWSAVLTLVDGEPASSTVRASIELDSLAVRDGTGGALPMTDADRREINRQMHKILGTGRATFTASRAAPDAAGGGDIDGDLELNGVRRPLRLRVAQTEPRRYRGTATVRQTEHRIKPYSSFLGALKLRDAVQVTVEVDLDRATRPDTADPT